MNVVLFCRPQGLPGQDIGHPTPSDNWLLQRNNQRLVNHHNASQNHSKERKNIQILEAALLTPSPWLDYHYVQCYIKQVVLNVHCQLGSWQYLFCDTDIETLNNQRSTNVITSLSLWSAGTGHFTWYMSSCFQCLFAVPWCSVGAHGKKLNLCSSEWQFSRTQ